MSTVVPLCAGSSRYHSELSFHCFSKDTGLRAQWLHKIRRTGFLVTQHKKVSSRHFENAQIRITAKGRQVLPASAMPSLFEWSSYTNSKTQAHVWEHRTRPTSSPEPGPVETEEEIVEPVVVEPMVPMLVDHDYGASHTVCVDREQYEKMHEEIESIRQQLETLCRTHLDSSGLLRHQRTSDFTLGKISTTNL